jgi:cold-inducible RNA-binding protein
MSKRLYVGNLPFTTSEQELQTLFEPYGATSVALPIDHDGRPKGFGFVEVEANQMNAAISALDGKEVGGRTLRVNEARPREDRGSRGGYGGGRSGGGW